MASVCTDKYCYCARCILLEIRQGSSLIVKQRFTNKLSAYIFIDTLHYFDTNKYNVFLFINYLGPIDKVAPKVLLNDRDSIKRFIKYSEPYDIIFYGTNPHYWYDLHTSKNIFTYACELNVPLDTLVYLLQYNTYNVHDLPLLYLNSECFNELFHYYVNKIKITVRKGQLNEFLIKYIIYNPKSCYIKRIVNSF
jgi:hypothetical protein